MCIPKLRNLTFQSTGIYFFSLSRMNWQRVHNPEKGCQVSCAGSREICVWTWMSYWSCELTAAAAAVGRVFHGKIFLCSRSQASLLPFNNIHLTPSFCMHVSTHESRKSKEDCLFWVVVTLFWTQWITMMMMIEIENHYPFSNFLLLFKSMISTRLISKLPNYSTRPAFLATLFEKSNICPKIQFWQSPNIFTSFSPKIVLTIFLVKSKLSTAKKSKTTTFSRVFHPKKTRQISREIKVEFLDKKWRFRTVC